VSRIPSQRPRRPYTEVSTDIVHVTNIGINKERYFSIFINGEESKTEGCGGGEGKARRNRQEHVRRVGKEE
jgi:hypothetical protein